MKTHRISYTLERRCNIKLFSGLSRLFDSLFLRFLMKKEEINSLVNYKEYTLSCITQ